MYIRFVSVQKWLGFGSHLDQFRLSSGKKDNWKWWFPTIIWKIIDSIHVALSVYTHLVSLHIWFYSGSRWPNSACWWPPHNWKMAEIGVFFLIWKTDHSIHFKHDVYSGVCHISERLEKSKSESRSFDSSWDLAVRRPPAYWIKAQGVVSLTFHELSKIISRKYTMPVITFMVIISSWDFVRMALGT